MKIDWREFCRATGFAPFDGGVEVRFDNGRSQKVAVEDHSDAFLVCSTVARAATVSEMPDAAMRAWIRNRSVTLVGFRVDERGRMIGEAWILKAGLTAAEFQLYVRTVSQECDRFEFQLTGSDME
ncbi:MAG: YbjN domain-containing protein [Verrucomicrobia bacterium]|nr:YbjN domain-containing protein [Verrucomicrobiota bacterium]